MTKRHTLYTVGAMRGLDDSPLQRALACVHNALRVQALADQPDAESMCPHPSITVQAEIRQAIAYLNLASAEPRKASRLARFAPSATGIMVRVRD